MYLYIVLHFKEINTALKWPWPSSPFKTVLETILDVGPFSPITCLLVGCICRHLPSDRSVRHVPAVSPAVKSGQ